MSTFNWKVPDDHTGLLFENFKLFISQEDGEWPGWPKDRLGCFACPFYALRPQLYDGRIKISSCQGWSLNDISAVKEHISKLHLPKGDTSTSQKPLARPGGKRLKPQADIPKITDQARVEKWKDVKTNGTRGTKTDKELWWDIAHVAVGIEIPHELPATKHLACCAGFSFIKSFNDFLVRRHGRGLGNELNVLLDPRLFPGPPAQDMQGGGQSGETLTYTDAELQELRQVHWGDGTEYRPATGLDDSAYGSSELTGGSVGVDAVWQEPLEYQNASGFALGMSDSPESGDH